MKVEKEQHSVVFGGARLLGEKKSVLKRQLVVSAVDGRLRKMV